jgi:hypothetical protein
MIFITNDFLVAYISLDNIKALNLIYFNWLVYIAYLDVIDLTDIILLF